LPQGFEFYDASAARYSDFPAGDPEGGIRQVTKVALEWLDGGDRTPPFLFLHCFDLHGPYASSGEFAGMFEGDELWQTDDVRFAGGITNSYDVIPDYITANQYSEGETPERLPTGPITARYDEGMAQTDAAVGELFDELRARGLYDEAMIVIAADHGETMAEKDFLFGHSVVDEMCAHVPLIIKLPGGEGGGRRVEQTVQNVDIYPTILELAGIGADRGYLHGRSLVPLLRGEDLPDAPALTETGVVEQSAVHLGGWKLVVQRPGRQATDATLLTHPRVPRPWLEEHFPEVLDRPMTEELLAELRERDDFRRKMRDLRAAGQKPVFSLYDLRSDPGELDDLVGENEAKLAELAQVLERLAARRDEAAALADRRDGTVELSEEDIEELRKLGYAGD
jgi:hypothetical protein